MYDVHRTMIPVAHHLRLPVVVLVALFAGACKKSAATADAGATVTSASVASPSVPLPKGTKIDAAAVVEVPPIARLSPAQVFDFAGTVTTMQLCRMDASAPTIFASDSSLARAPLAAAPDGSLWVLDHQKKLRHYVNRAPRGCELVLDQAFGDHGMLDLAALGSERYGRVLVDARGVVYLSGDTTKKLQGGKLVEHCAGEWMRTDPTTKLAIGNRTSVTKDGACEATNASFGGFDPKAPAYASPKAIGFFGDEIVVHGVDMDGTREIDEVGLHAPNGAQRIKMGGKSGDEALTSPEAATKCGDDLCVFGTMFDDIGISRYTRDGKLVQKVRLKVDGLKDAMMTTAGDGKLWISGAVRASYGEKGATPQDGYTGAIFLVRPVALDPPPASPSIAAALAAPRGDEPAHDGIIGPVKGTLRGRPILPITMRFEYRFGTWHFTANNAHGSHLTTQLLVAPAVGAVSVARAAGPKANCNAFLTTEDNPAEKMSSDAVGSGAHWIAIERWDVKPWDKSKGSTQYAGYASGRVWIDMPGSEGKNEDSRVAGVFEDAVVTYEEEPK